MAATTDHVAGAAFLVKAGGTTIGGGTGGTLYIEREMLEHSPATVSYDRTIIPGVIRWGGGGEFDYLKSAVGVKGCGAAVTFDGNTLLKLLTFNYQVSLSLKDRTDASSSCVRSVAVGKRSSTLSITCNYTDPAAAAATAEAALYTAMSTTTPTVIPVVVTWGTDQTLTFNAHPIRWELVNISDQRGETDVAMNIEMAVVGAVAVADVNNDAGLSGVVDAVHTGAGTAPTAVTLLYTDATDTHSAYTGSAYVTSYSLSGDANGIVAASAAWEGNGSLTKYTYNT